MTPKCHSVPGAIRLAWFTSTLLLDADDRVPDVATAPAVLALQSPPAVLALPDQREGAESDSRGVGRSLTA